MARLAPLALTLLAACAPDSAREPGVDPADPGPLSAVDADGRLVRLAAPPVRVLAASATGVDFVLDLDGPDRLVAVPDDAFQHSPALVDPDAWPPERVFAVFDSETALALEPDLVLAHPYQSAEALRTLRSAGVPVYVVPNVHELDDVWRALADVGRLLDREERAAEVRAAYEARIAELEADAPVERERAITYGNFGGSGWTAGARTGPSLILSLAGFEPAAVAAGIEGHQPVDFERLLVLDPDRIVVTASRDDLGSSATEDHLRAQSALESLRALEREGGVVRLPSGLLETTSHRLVDAAEELARRADR